MATVNGNKTTVKLTHLGLSGYGSGADHMDLLCRVENEYRVAVDFKDGYFTDKLEVSGGTVARREAAAKEIARKLGYIC